ncbi:MAG: D-alanine--D-alanine ligase [Chitinophagaceae bacterium]|nr:D-alanine--D-alanine ligase [Chitinophagaceae bacterium]
MKKFKLFIHKLTHWEYWPFDLVYIPMYFVWFYYAAKARSFFFFNAANPTIKNAGFLMESKKEIYDIIPPEFIPNTLFFKAGTDVADILKAVEQAGIVFPCIAKPDIGGKGRGVEKIHDLPGIVSYAARIKMDFLVQEFIPYPEEVGIFYCRLPDQPTGFISGIVAKEFLIVTGDGASSLTRLIEKDPRFHLQLSALEKIYGDGLQEVLASGETKNLVPYGNHARGAKFIDVSHWADEKFTKIFDGICKQIPEFYFGRLDIMYRDLDDLKAGSNFSIIELNGAGSEPTHIYDPSHSLFFAWKEIARHFKLLYSISIQNHKRGFRYLTVKEGMQMFRENNAVVKSLKQF